MWIPVEVTPKEDQKVFYRYVGGIYAGTYYGIEEGLHCFGGDSGFLCGDVTHWMPREEGDDWPGNPE